MKKIIVLFCVLALLIFGNLYVILITPKFRVIEVVDIQNLYVMDWYKKEHINDNIYYVALDGEKYVHSGGVTSCKEVIKPKGWAKTGDLIDAKTILSYFKKYEK